MEGIGDRIGLLIAKNSGKQVEFARRMKIDQSYVSQLISGKRQPSEMLIKAICREFGVNPEWLVNGEGPMATPTRSRTLDTVARRYSSSTTFRAMLDAYAQLDEAGQAAIERYVGLLHEAMEAGRPVEAVKPSQTVRDVLGETPQSPEARPDRAQGE